MDLVRLLNNVKRLFQNKAYIRKENTPLLSREQYSALNIGAVNAEQNQYYCNCLETEPDKRDVKNRLRDYYGIIDRASAIETLDWLLQRGHHIYFESIRPVIANTSSEFNLDVLLGEEQEHSLIMYVNNINDSLETLVHENIIQGASEFKTLAVDAWDLGRLVLVSRCCYDSQYISEEEAWQYIMSAYKKAKELYKNWQDFANGYIVGRAMWNGNDFSLIGIINIANGLQKDENSPWIKYPLH